MNTKFAFFFLFFAIAATIFAEKIPEKREDASHVIVGTVKEIYKSDNGEHTSYIVLIKIETVEKGKGYKEGEFLYASCFKRKPIRTILLVPGTSGHKSVPARGERIRAFINKADGLMEGVYPEWYDLLKKKP